MVYVVMFTNYTNILAHSNIIILCIYTCLSACHCLYNRIIPLKLLLFPVCWLLVSRSCRRSCQRPGSRQRWVAQSAVWVRISINIFIMLFTLALIYIACCLGAKFLSYRSSLIFSSILFCYSNSSSFLLSSPSLLFSYRNFSSFISSPLLLFSSLLLS